MTREELKDKARSLPLEPGVYLMHDKSGKIIYVGKAKKLKNRVSQYFQDTASHSPKTKKMVSQVADFEVIAARSEFEALVLECSLIKRHMPKYNILLKDAKGYPYLRVDLREAYPVITMVSRTADDGAQYFGPFGGRYVTQHVLDTLRKTFRLPGCSKSFPRDLGKERPCLNYHMDNCAGWCRGLPTAEEYRAAIDQAVQVLQGHYQSVAAELRRQMQAAAEELAFERAAALRNQLQSLTALGEKQLVTAGTLADTDVIGYAQNGVRSCFVVLHYVGGNLLDKDYEILPSAEPDAEAVGALVKQYYLTRGAVPGIVLLPVEMEDAPLFAELLQQQLGRKVRLRRPQRGDGAHLLELAAANARQELERITDKAERAQGLLQQLQQMLGLPEPPQRIESYDISHLDGTDIVASMVVFTGAKPSPRDYRRFQLRDMPDQNDIGSMRQIIHRRFTHYLAQDKGFEAKPDLLLIDGGDVHAAAVCDELAQLGLQFPVYGMVKDDRHRTRALLSPQGEQIGIAAVPALFALIGQIQEQTHNYAIGYHRKLRSRRLQRSKLDEIPGVGDKRKQALLRRFGTLGAIRAASVAELAEVVPTPVATQIYEFFRKEGDSPK